MISKEVNVVLLCIKMLRDFFGEILKSFQKVDHSISVRPL